MSRTFIKGQFTGEATYKNLERFKGVWFQKFWDNTNNF
jgi:hypothetical protein